MPPEGRIPLPGDASGQQHVAPTLQPVELGAQVVGAFGLRKKLSVQIQHLIAAQDQRIGPPRRSPPRLEFGQRIGDVARPGTVGQHRALHGVLVDRNRQDLMSDAGLLKETLAHGRTRGKDQRGAHGDASVDNGINIDGTKGPRTLAPDRSRPRRPERSPRRRDLSTANRFFHGLCMMRAGSGHPRSIHRSIPRRTAICPCPHGKNRDCPRAGTANSTALATARRDVGKSRQAR